MGAETVMPAQNLAGRQGVVIDTMVFIYLFEDHSGYADLCEDIFGQISNSVFSGVVTPITAAELLVKPLKLKQLSLADRYRSAIRNIPNVSMSRFDVQIGFMAGSLRAQYDLPLADMFQAAAAMYYPARTLITNDKNLRRVKEIDVFLLDEMMR
jgi:predicted nucleic acid-binding protein